MQYISRTIYNGADPKHHLKRPSRDLSPALSASKTPFYAILAAIIFDVWNIGAVVKKAVATVASKWCDNHLSIGSVSISRNVVPWRSP